MGPRRALNNNNMSSQILFCYKQRNTQLIHLSHPLRNLDGPDFIKWPLFIFLLRFSQGLGLFLMLHHDSKWLLQLQASRPFSKDKGATGQWNVSVRFLSLKRFPRRSQQLPIGKNCLKASASCKRVLRNSISSLQYRKTRDKGITSGFLRATLWIPPQITSR